MKKLGLLLLLIPLFALATIYKYDAKDGKTYYTNEKPTGLTTAEKAQFITVTTGTVDALTKTTNLPLSNRDAVKKIMKADNAPVPPTPTPVTIEPPPHATWCEATCTLPAGVTAKVWYGVAQKKWVTKDGLTGSFTCNDTTFGSNAGTTAYKRCAWVDMATLGALNPNGVNLMPYVDMSALPPVYKGSGTLNLKSIPVIAGRDPLKNGGEFRIRCGVSHLAKDDPIVYPNVPGASHLHAFFGNSDISAYSTNESLTTSGNSTCSGGIANRSGYWVPTLIDTTTGIAADVVDVITYYKADGDPTTTADYTTVPPKGLRMIAGNQRPMSIADSSADFLCMDDRQVMNPANWGIIWQKDHIEACGDGTSHMSIRFKVSFPSCWDGKNLDSPDHQSHMAYPCKFGACELANGSTGKTVNGCPITHPVLIPHVTVNANYINLKAGHTYRLSSDNYDTKYAGGYSLHADWMNGWDETILTRVVDSCLKKHANCETDQLGDGQALVPYK